MEINVNRICNIVHRKQTKLLFLLEENFVIEIQSENRKEYYAIEIAF